MTSPNEIGEKRLILEGNGGFWRGVRNPLVDMFCRGCAPFFAGSHDSTTRDEGGDWRSVGDENKVSIAKSDFGLIGGKCFDI
jgi:hypothetical protein